MQRSTLCVAIVSMAAGLAQADTLWDQSAINFGSPTSFPNAVAPGFNGYTIFAVSDVTVPAGGWTVQSVSTYFSALSWFDGDVTSAVLNIFPKSAALPVAGNDPRSSPTGAGTLVPVTMTMFDVEGNGVSKIQTSGLNIALAPGNYWVGLTPIGPAGAFGPDLQWVSSTIGNSQAYRSYPGGNWLNEAIDMGIPSGDGAILIEGVVPSPASLGLLGLGGILFSRRRR